MVAGVGHLAQYYDGTGNASQDLAISAGHSLVVTAVGGLADRYFAACEASQSTATPAGQAAQATAGNDHGHYFAPAPKRSA